MNSQFVDPARLFAEAQRVFTNGDGTSAVEILDRLPSTFASDGRVLHFRALALKKAGRPEQAVAAFERARRIAPRDPEVANNYANLLMQTGMTEAALVLYNEAILLQPDYADARLNRALALQRLGRPEEALTDVVALIVAGRASARVHSAHGTMLLMLNRHDEAAEAFDHSLATGQKLPTALHGRARVALERGEAEAGARYRLAQSVLPDDPEVLLGLAESMEAEGNPAGIILLAKAVTERPEWLVGFERLARMRAEAGEADFAAHYQPAIELAADQRPLRLSLAKMLADSDLHLDALDVLAPLPENRAVTVLRAFYRGEAGDPGGGLTVLGDVKDSDDAETLMMAGRLALASGDLDHALSLLDRAVAAAPGVVSVWAHCDLAWRAAGDPRAEWLSGQEGLIATGTLSLAPSEIAALAELLRSLHRTHAHPIGQSLRGGTQTRGRLFRRQEPEIRRLHDALTTAIADYVGGLPPGDPRHPLLKYRNQVMAIAGSWSVRLSGSGFHVQHIHPEGLLSSACYLALPEDVVNSATRDGWLEIGRPPPSLNLALEPVKTIEPAVGRLALFPSYLYHGTRPFNDGERLSVAFDVVLK